MFAESIREGKRIPDYSRSDNFHVSLALRGEIERPEFVRFLEGIVQERQARFSVEDLLILDLIEREESIWDELKPRLVHLEELGAVERIGKGRGVRYILSRKLYSFLGWRGAYTRRRGLDRETNKTLLLRHIQDNQRDGARLAELLEVLPGLSQPQIRTLLKELKREGKAHVVGATRAGRWYPGPG